MEGCKSCHVQEGPEQAQQMQAFTVGLPQQMRWQGQQCRQGRRRTSLAVVEQREVPLRRHLAEEAPQCSRSLRKVDLTPHRHHVLSARDSMSSAG